MIGVAPRRARALHSLTVRSLLNAPSPDSANCARRSDAATRDVAGFEQRERRGGALVRTLGGLATRLCGRLVGLLFLC